MSVAIGYMNNVNALRNQSLAEPERLYVIDFYATWCGPCKALAPKLELVATEMPAIRFLKTNADDELAAEMLETFNVAKFPTLVFYRAGNELERMTGTNMETIKAMITKHNTSTT